MNLVYLAQKNKLPKHQYMDYETLLWIVKNRPPFLPQTHYKIHWTLSKYLKRFIPSEDWFLNPREVHGIHGMRHLLRVMIYGILLCNYQRNRKVNKNRLAIAAVIHDIRRRDSKRDLKHGERGAKWFLENIKKIEQHFQIGLEENGVNSIFFN